MGTHRSDGRGGVNATIRYSATDAASRAIAGADPALARVIAELGCVEFTPPTADTFEVLVRGIVGQQLSGAAASAIFERLREQIGLAPAALLDASDERLRAAGLSRAKAGYVRGLAAAAASGELDVDRLRALDDDAAIRELTRFRGIGRWTAELFLMFGLGRPDVIPADDLGLRTAAGRAFGLDRPMTADELRAAAGKWRPYRSAAALYLWRSGRTVVGACPDATDARDGEGGTR